MRMPHHLHVPSTSETLQQAASGILYLHSLKIIHRDIKPANILIGAKMGTAKVADYGTSRVADTSKTMTFAGTLVYIAPEISRFERYSFPADVYSFGLTMYALCDREAPFTEAERRNMKFALDVSDHGYRPHLRGWWNPAVSLLISSCWSHDQRLRPEMRQVISSLKSIMSGAGGLITCGKMKGPVAQDGHSLGQEGVDENDLVVGEAWHRIEVDPRMITKGKTLAAGA